jgi:hypothetical protein
LVSRSVTCGIPFVSHVLAAFKPLPKYATLRATRDMSISSAYLHVAVDADGKLNLSSSISADYRFSCVSDLK